MKGRLRLNLQSRFSSFEDYVLWVLAVFKQKKELETMDSRLLTVCSVIVSAGNTSGVGPIPISTVECPAYLLSVR